MKRKNRGKNAALLSTSLAVVLAVADLPASAVSSESVDIVGRNLPDAVRQVDKGAGPIVLAKKQDDRVATVSSAKPAKSKPDRRVRPPRPPRRRPPASPAK